MQTQTFLSTNYKTFDEFDKAVSAYGTILEKLDYEVESSSSITSVAVPRQLANKMTEIQIQVIVMKTICGYGVDEDEAELSPGIPRLSIPAQPTPSPISQP